MYFFCFLMYFFFIFFLTKFSHKNCIGCSLNSYTFLLSYSSFSLKKTKTKEKIRAIFGQPPARADWLIHGCRSW